MFYHQMAGGGSLYSAATWISRCLLKKVLQFLANFSVALFLYISQFYDALFQNRVTEIGYRVPKVVVIL